jgi:DMSO/TMAO reductase YedYZ molybdopterin-dependent catalytic subunit
MKKHKIAIVAIGMTLLALLAVVAGGALVPSGTPKASAADAVVLTITGTDPSNVKTFTMADLQALPSYSGYAGIIKSTGTIEKPQAVKGVALKDLFDQVGGMTAQNAGDVLAPDLYGATLTYDQVVNGAFSMYNADTGKAETPKAPVTAVLTYEENGQPIAPAPGGNGPLRLAICQPTDTNQVADGELSVKWVNQLTLRAAVKPWSVKMIGLKRKDGTRQTYTLTRQRFDACATPGCHGSSWVNPTSHMTLSGVPLFLCIGKVDGGTSHGGYSAYNDALALKGYRIKLTSATGAYVIVGSRVIRDQARIILANKRQGSELPANYYPLRLVGPKIGSGKFLSRITKIQLLPK